MTADRVEAELKFRAENDYPLQALAAAAALGPARLGPARVVEEVDRYLDTPDGRLAGARWACRLRTRDGRTTVSLKGPAEHASGEVLHRRPEIEGPVGAGLVPSKWPASGARDRLVALCGGAPLREHIVLEQQRTERAVALAAVQVGLLSLDRVRVLRRGIELGHLALVELELDPAALASGVDHASLAAALAATPGLTADPSSKLERALTMASIGGERERDHA